MTEAKINKEYLLRMVGVAAFMLGISIWSIYDGFVAWPEKNREFEAVRPMLLSTNLSAKAWLAKTGAEGQSPLDLVFAEAKLKKPSKLVKKIDEYKMADNLPQELLAQGREREKEALKHIFENPLYGPGDLQGQLVMAVITALVALWVALSFIPKLSRRFIADESGLHGSGFGGELIKYSDIDSMDWKLWDKKGIIKVTVRGGAQHTLDGWHFNGIKGIVDLIIEQRPDLGRADAHVA
jgi:hypothetical protein